MTQIYIIGTDHNFQKGQGCHKEDVDVFKEYIHEMCDLTQAKAIGEEMSREALDEAGVKTSVCEVVANELTLRYCLCDPDRATRQKLGIRQENDIRLEGFQNDWAPEIVKKKISDEHRKREEIWLSHIDNLYRYPVLFVCGANHVKSFSDLLSGKGLRSQVLSEDWAPNQTMHRIADKSGSR